MAEDKGIKEAGGKTQTSGFWFLLIHGGGLLCTVPPDPYSSGGPKEGPVNSVHHSLKTLPTCLPPTLSLLVSS